jgi:hypothetical protein
VGAALSITEQLAEQARNDRKRKERLFEAAKTFARKVAGSTSIHEVALCGSMVTEDPYPPDIDLAIVVDSFSGTVDRSSRSSDHLDLPRMGGMQGLQLRYTGYYNRKYKRVGYLFQGRYKAILCDRQAYLLELARYLHLNPGLMRAPWPLAYRARRAHTQCLSTARAAFGTICQH